MPSWSLPLAILNNLAFGLVWLIRRFSTFFLTLPDMLSSFRAGSLHKQVRLEAEKEYGIRQERSQKMWSCLHYPEVIFGRPTGRVKTERTENVIHMRFIGHLMSNVHIHTK